MKKKKRYSSEEKAIILREYLENNLSLSEIAEKYEVHPNAIYQWKKKMFENAPDNLSATSSKRNDKTLATAEKRIAELEAVLSKREKLIAELVEENIDLKKKDIGGIFVKNGLNRK